MTTRDQITFPENYDKSNVKSESDLMVAIRFSKLGNNLEIAKSLLENYGDINKQDKKGRTLLINALLIEDDTVNTEIIKIIIEKGANVNKIINPIIPFLNKLTTENLISSELSQDIHDCINKRYDDNIPLMLALEKNYVDIMDILLEKGANIDERNSDGYTILIKSIRNKNLEAIKLVLKYKPNIEILSNTKRTALYYTINDFNIDSIKLLLDAGAYMYSKNNSDSPFIKVIDNDLSYKGCNASKLFFEKGADIKMLNKNGVEYLRRAISKKNLPLIKLLIENGVDVNNEDINSVSSLLYAFEKSKNDDLLEIIKLMISKGGKYDQEYALNNTDASNTQLIKMIKCISDKLLKDAIKVKNINMIKLLILKKWGDNDTFLEIIRLNNLELVQLYCEHNKSTLFQSEILEKIINDAISIDILDFIYEKFQ